MLSNAIPRVSVRSAIVSPVIRCPGAKVQLDSMPWIKAALVGAGHVQPLLLLFQLAGETTPTTMSFALLWVGAFGDMRLESCLGSMGRLVEGMACGRVCLQCSVVGSKVPHRWVSSPPATQLPAICRAERADRCLLILFSNESRIGRLLQPQPCACNRCATDCNETG